MSQPPAKRQRTEALEPAQPSAVASTPTPAASSSPSATAAPPSAATSRPSVDDSRPAPATSSGSLLAAPPLSVPASAPASVSQSSAPAAVPRPSASASASASASVTPSSTPQTAPPTPQAIEELVSSCSPAQLKSLLTKALGKDAALYRDAAQTVSKAKAAAAAKKKAPPPAWDAHRPTVDKVREQTHGWQHRSEGMQLGFADQIGFFIEECLEDVHSGWRRKKKYEVKRSMLGALVDIYGCVLSAPGPLGKALRRRTFGWNEDFADIRSLFTTEDYRRLAKDEGFWDRLKSLADHCREHGKCRWMLGEEQALMAIHQKYWDGEGHGLDVTLLDCSCQYHKSGAIPYLGDPCMF